MQYDNTEIVAKNEKQKKNGVFLGLPCERQKYIFWKKICDTDQKYIGGIIWKGADLLPLSPFSPDCAAINTMSVFFSADPSDNDSYLNIFFGQVVFWVAAYSAFYSMGE